MFEVFAVPGRVPPLLGQILSSRIDSDTIATIRSYVAACVCVCGVVCGTKLPIRLPAIARFENRLLSIIPTQTRGIPSW